MEVDKDFIVNGISINKGKYELFTISGKAEWIVIINKNFNQDFTDDYQQSEDIVRIKVKPKKLKNQLKGCNTTSTQQELTKVISHWHGKSLQ